ASEISASRRAEAGQGSGHVDCADVPADPGGSASVLEEPRRGRLSGTTARTQELGAERAADAYQQGRRPVPAHAAGARSATYPGAIRRRLRSQALGTKAGGTRRTKRQKAGYRGHGQKASSVVASPVGERRSVRALTPQPSSCSSSSCLTQKRNTKQNRSRKRKTKA